MLVRLEDWMCYLMAILKKFEIFDLESLRYLRKWIGEEKIWKEKRLKIIKWYLIRFIIIKMIYNHKKNNDSIIF